MLKFKTDNAEVIVAAKEELHQKIEAELKAMADKEARKKEITDGKNTEIVLPSQTTAS